MALPFLFSMASPIPASELTKGKIGFGFDPGLVAGKDYVEKQLVVGMKKGMAIQSIESFALSTGARVAKEIENAVLLSFDSEQAVIEAANKLIARPDVAFVERNGIMRIPPKPTLQDIKNEKKNSVTTKGMSPLSVSPDAGTGYQWHQTVIRKTAALPALSATPPTVAVVDTGVDYTHPDLAGQVILGKNCVANSMDPFDDNGHGTHVAGIIAAKGGNGQYGEGVSPNSKILAVKVLSAEGWGTWFDIACGMDYARTAATIPATKVINMSLGGGYSELIHSKVVAIKSAGKVLVAAAGNSDTADTTYAQPGADPDTALRVMATEENDCRAWFSNFSPVATPGQYNIAAPGWEIPSTVPGAGFEPMSGTSMASPVVAGAAALVWGQLPTLTRETLVSRLVANGKVINCGFAATTKRVDVSKAITGASETAIVGRVLDPFTGKAPSPPTVPATVQALNGTTVLKSDATNTAGSYEMTGLTAGTAITVAGTKTGYIPGKLRSATSVASIVLGPFTDAFFKARPAGNATITVDWKTTQPIVRGVTGMADSKLGWELDLYVKLPSGSYVDPYFNNGDLTGAPYVMNPRDTYNDLEPLETVVIGSAAENGVYKVFVDKYPYSSTFNPSWTGSGASVQWANGGTLGAFYTVPATCDTNEYWYVGDLTKTGTSYTWTNQNVCSATMP